MFVCDLIMNSTVLTPTYKTYKAISVLDLVSGTNYGYIPNLWGNAFLTTFYECLLIISLFCKIIKRIWTYLLGVSVGYAWEVRWSNPNEGAIIYTLGCSLGWINNFRGYWQCCYYRSSKYKLLDTGKNLMLAGIAFQVATRILCGTLFLTYTLHYTNVDQQYTVHWTQVFTI